MLSPSSLIAVSCGVCSTVALRLSGDGSSTFAQLLDAASEVASRAFAHGVAPFARVVDALSLARTASYTPVYQVTLAPRSAVTEGVICACIHRVSLSPGVRA